MMKLGKLAVLCLVWGLICPGLLYGQEQPKEQAIDEILVETERLVEEQGRITVRSEGLPAEVEVITKEDLKTMPLRNYTDMFRRVPGVRVTRYDRGDMGDAVAFRGFTSGHGYQVAYFIDGVPMNMVQGFTGSGGLADIGWLIPEMVERIEVIKGPFSALYGDFALAGVINIITKKSDPAPSLGAYGGTYGIGQAVGVLSNESWQFSPLKFTPFLVWEGYNRDGYRDNADYLRGQFFNKLTVPLLQGDLSLRIHYVARRFGDPSPLLVSEVQAGRPPTDAVDPTDRGDIGYFNVVLNYSPTEEEKGFYGTLYFNNWQFTRGTTFRPSPQDRYDDRRNYLGWKLFYNFQPVEQFSLLVGNDLRYDDIKCLHIDTLKRYNILNWRKEYHIKQLNTAFFTQGQYKPFSFLKIIGGLRYDFFNIDVANKLNPVNSGVATPGIFSPKIGVVITPYKDINIYTNKGLGFRSPTANEMSPVIGSKDFNLSIPQVDTWDVGINALVFDRLFFGFNYYDTKLQDEIWYNPATGLYQNIGDSVRSGFDLETKIFLTKELTLFGSYGYVRGRLKNPLVPGRYYIGGLSPNTSTVGFEYNKQFNSDHRFGVDFYYVRYSRAPVTPDGTKIRPQYDQFLSRISYGYKNWTALMDVFFSPRKYSTESMGWSSAYNTFTFWPKPSWEVQGGLKYEFN